MSSTLNADVLLDDDDLDALNDETFGCDVNDINDDWEAEHEKNTSVLETSTNKKQDISVNVKLELLKACSSFNESSSKKSTLLEDFFPDCEDIVKKSLNSCFIDEDDGLYEDDEDLYPRFVSYEVGAQHDLGNEANKSKPNNSKNKNIDLDSLRPPSPSILPAFDDPLMSSVWRPLSPELGTGEQNNKTNSIQAIFNDSKIMTLEELESNLHSNGHHEVNVKTLNISKEKVFRLEDLEAALQKDRQPAKQFPSVSFSNSTSSNQTPSKMTPNLMELAALSLKQLQNPSLPIIPTSKVVPPPPGLEHRFKVPPASMPGDATSKVPVTIHTMPKPTIPAPNQVLNTMPCPINNMNPLSMLPQTHQLLSSMVNTKIQGAPIILDPRVQQEQQRIINKIITPAQAQRSYPSHLNNYMKSSYRNQDHYAGFMTQKEKEWLLKIFRLQCKVNDPYVEDFYEVNYNLKKSLLAKRKSEMKDSDGIADSIVDSEPLCVLPEFAKVENEKPKYIQFDNALGKIQVLNSKCPRKLLDIDQNRVKQHVTYKLDTYNQLLLKIERFYEYILNIEDEDKRLPILPDDVKPLHVEKRGQLCNILFDGLVTKSANQAKFECAHFTLINRNMPTLQKLQLEVDPQLLLINKGVFLIYRSLFQLRDENQILILLTSLLKNFEKHVFEAERNSKINYSSMLVKAVSRVSNTKNLVYLMACVASADLFTKNKVCFLCQLFEIDSHLSPTAWPGPIDHHIQTIRSIKRQVAVYILLVRKNALI